MVTNITYDHARAIAAHLPGWFPVQDVPDAWERLKTHWLRRDIELWQRAILIYEPTYHGAELHLQGNAWRVPEGQYHCFCAGHDTTTYQSEEIRKALGVTANISAKKSPEQIAKELQRRVINVYLPTYSVTQRTLQNALGRWKSQKKLAEELFALFPEGGGLTQAMDHGKESRLWTGKDPYITFRVSGPNTVHVEQMHLNAHQAREFARLITSWYSSLPTPHGKE